MEHDVSTEYTTSLEYDMHFKNSRNVTVDKTLIVSGPIYPWVIFMSW